MDAKEMIANQLRVLSDMEKERMNRAGHIRPGPPKTQEERVNIAFDQMSQLMRDHLGDMILHDQYQLGLSHLRAGWLSLVSRRQRAS